MRERMRSDDFRVKFARLVRQKTGEEVVTAPLITEERVVRADGGPSWFSWRLWRPWEIVLLTLGCIAICLCCIGAGVYVWRINHKQPGDGVVFSRGPHMPTAAQSQRDIRLPGTQSRMFGPPESRI